MINKKGTDVIGFHEDYWFKTLRKVAETGNSIIYENYSQTRDIYFELYAWKVNETDVAALLNDVTEQKKNAILKQLHIEDLEDKNRNLFTLLELNANMFQILEAIYDGNGEVIDFYFRKVDDNFVRNSGKSREEIIGKTMKNVFGIIEDYWIENLSKVAKTAEPTVFKAYSAARNKYFDTYS